jgi:hypothetical protein
MSVMTEVSVCGVIAIPPIIGPKKSAPPNGSTGATTVRVPDAVAFTAESSAIFSARR